MPVDVLFRSLLDLRDKTPAHVETVLRRATIAWILKKEDKTLTDEGYRSNRPDHWRAYDEVGIRLIYRACGRCRREAVEYDCDQHGSEWESV